MIGVEMFKEKAEKPKRNKSGKWKNILMEFVKSDNQTLKVNCADEDEVKRCRSAFDHLIRKNNLGLVTWKKNCTVIVIKA